MLILIVNIKSKKAKRFFFEMIQVMLVSDYFIAVMLVIFELYAILLK